jgi:hypothetical protein
MKHDPLIGKSKQHRRRMDLNKQTLFSDSHELEVRFSFLVMAALSFQYSLSSQLCDDSSGPNAFALEVTAPGALPFDAASPAALTALVLRKYTVLAVEQCMKLCLEVGGYGHSHHLWTTLYSTVFSKFCPTL